MFVFSFKRIIDIEWLFRDSYGVETSIAVYAADNFAPLNSYVGRVIFVPNAGISLPGITQADGGTYQAVVNGLDANGDFVFLNTTAFVSVSDSKLKYSTTL